METTVKGLGQGVRIRLQEVLEVGTCQCSRGGAILTIPVAEIPRPGQPATTIS